MTVNFKSDAIIGKFAILIVGIPSLALGLFSQFQSIWTKGLLVFPYAGPDMVPVYRICEFQTHIYHLKDKACPNIELEQFFVSVIIICFPLSLLNFIMGFLVDLRKYQWKFLDTAYHLLSSLLLFVGGSLYLLSAVQIYNMNITLKDIDHPESSFNFRTYEKLAAGCLTIMQAVLYGGVAHFIWKQK